MNRSNNLNRLNQYGGDINFVNHKRDKYQSKAIAAVKNIDLDDFKYYMKKVSYYYGGKIQKGGNIQKGGADGVDEFIEEQKQRINEARGKFTTEKRQLDEEIDKLIKAAQNIKEKFKEENDELKKENE